MTINTSTNTNRGVYTRLDPAQVIVLNEVLAHAVLNFGRYDMVGATTGTTNSNPPHPTPAPATPNTPNNNFTQTHQTHQTQNNIAILGNLAALAPSQELSIYQGGITYCLEQCIASANVAWAMSKTLERGLPVREQAQTQLWREVLQNINTALLQQNTPICNHLANELQPRLRIREYGGARSGLIYLPTVREYEGRKWAADNIILTYPQRWEMTQLRLAKSKRTHSLTLEDWDNAQNYLINNATAARWVTEFEDIYPSCVTIPF